MKVLIANEPPSRQDALAAEVVTLGHDPVPDDAQADVALVGRAGDDEPALALITTLVHERGLPVVVTLPEHDRGYIRRAANAGAFGCVVGLGVDELERALEIAVGRYSHYRGLLAAFTRRSVVERAKGILMARYAVDQDEAFQMLRRDARRTSRKLVDVAETVSSDSGEVVSRPD